MRALAVSLTLLLAALSSLPGKVSSKRVTCYYASWAIYRTGDGQFQPENINISLCTHIVYAFAGINNATNEIMTLDSWNDLPSGLNGYNRFTKMVPKNSSVVAMLGVGGWNEGSEKYSAMAATASSRQAFINSAIIFLETYGFKGLDLDWEYPTQRGGKPEDKENFVLLLQGLKSALSSRNFTLSIAVAVNTGIVDDGYDIKNITKYVDFIDLLSFDYHTYSDNYTSHGEPLYSRPEEDQNYCVNASLHYWLAGGAPAEKLSLGLAMYGHTYTLEDPAANEQHNNTIGPGLAGTYTGSPGTLGYNEICLNNWGATVDSYWEAPYAYSGDQWVSYDDPSSVKSKCQLVKDLGLGGVWAYSLDTDDFRGTCGKGKYPLLNSLYNNC